MALNTIEDALTALEAGNLDQCIWTRLVIAIILI